MNELMLLAALTVSPALQEISITGPEAEPPGSAVVRTIDAAPSASRETGIRLMPGWPRSVGSGLYSPARGVALADFDSDGRLEVIMPAGDGRIHVWRHDGSYYSGWPVNLAVDSCQYAAAVADVDLDGQYEVAVGTRSFVSGDGPVYLLTESGTIKTGWPFRGRGGYFNESPTLADVDNDDTLEVVIAERLWPGGFLYALRHDGRLQSGAWPCSLDHVPATGAAVGDLDGDGTVEIVQASYNSLYVLSATGAMRPGWPVTMPDNRNWSYQSPALADIDGDDTLEIITALHKEGGACYVFRHDGTIQPGWPCTYTRWTYCPPTVCNLDRDHSLEVICGLSAGVSGFSDVAYAYDADGGTLAGFPFVSQTGSNEPNLTVADLDGDGDMEILITSNLITSADSLGYIYALHHDGSQVAGFPLRPWGFTYLNGPNVADINGDDSLDIIAVSAHAGRLDVTIWETGVPFNRLSWEWPTYQFDMSRTGLYRRAQTGVAETPGGGSGKTMVQTIVRNVLLLPESPTTHASFVLLNSVGRKVMDLAAGTNDVRHLAPGVYFLRQPEERSATARKVVLAR